MSINELLVIFVIALLVFGPDKLPSLALRLGRAVKQVNRFKNNLMKQCEDAENAEKQLCENIKKALNAEKH